MTPEATLERAGVLLPTPHPAVGTYVMAARTGSLSLRVRSRRIRRWPPQPHWSAGRGALNRRRDRGGGGGDAEPVGHREAEVGDLSRVARFVKVVVFVNLPALCGTARRRRRRNRPTGPYLRRPHRSAGPVRCRGGCTAARVCRGDRGHRRGVLLRAITSGPA